LAALYVYDILPPIIGGIGGGFVLVFVLIPKAAFCKPSGMQANGNRSAAARFVGHESRDLYSQDRRLGHST
jgi:hypothetical protein